VKWPRMARFSSLQKDVNSVRSAFMPRCCWMIAAILALAAARLGAAEPGLNFDRDVRPILADNCFKCHGPDEKERKGKLRLDERDAAAKREAFSKLVGRITNPDIEQRMPPAVSGKKLSATQIDTLKRWIDQGAKYSTHWAFVPPTRPEILA